ncbi:class I SAM-dependent methyltransferase [soil metagenome]
MAATTPPSRDSVRQLFDTVSRGYDTPWIQRRFYQPAQEAILDELGTRQANNIVDVGCGTGILADRIQSTLAPHQVIGVDPSQGMLTNARARTSAVSWHVGTAENLPLPDESVDAVTTSTAFHFFDQPAALAEFYRVLIPGGIVVIGSIIQPTPTPRNLCGILARCTPGGYLAADSVPDLLTDAGFEVVRRRPINSRVSGWPLFYRVTVGVK